MDDQDIVAYLRQNPDFFHHHPQLLESLRIPHPQSGGAVSLMERQLVDLRQKHQTLQNKLSELLRFGEKNDQLSERLHEIALHLMEAQDFETLQMQLMEQLCKGFAVSEAHWRLWGWPNPTVQENINPFTLTSDALRNHISKMRAAYSGSSRGMEWLTQWLPELPPSLALMPLYRDENIAGALLLTSNDPRHFQVDMGHLYLDQLADLVAAALNRTLQD